jgi:uncharacterized protein YqjF (DUF2071 family)
MVMPAIGAAAGATESLITSLGASHDAVAQAGSLGEYGHRPWPLPSRPWLMGQTWRDLLFAHWPVSVEALRARVPDQIPIDTFAGSAWIGITPFEVTGLRLRGTVPPPFLSRFPETNVRTYATIDGKPGIFFLSLDAASRSAVAAARRAYRLPYFHATMRIHRRGSDIYYRSDRLSSDGEPARLRLGYRPIGEVRPAAPGTLEYFLVERYCLYTLDEGGGVLRGDIHHPPWPLQLAEAGIDYNTMTRPYDIDIPTEVPLLHFARRQDVVIWSLAPAA